MASASFFFVLLRGSDAPQKTEMFIVLFLFSLPSARMAAGFHNGASFYIGSTQSQASSVCLCHTPLSSAYTSSLQISMGLQVNFM